MLPYRPGEGWAAAGQLHRLLAIGFVALIPVLALVGVTDQGILVAFVVLAWVPCTAAAARVLRPYPPGQVDLERRVRHGCAALASSVGCAFLIVLTGLSLSIPEDANGIDDGSSGDWVMGFAGLAAWAVIMAIVTVVWGVLASLVRASRAAAREEADLIG